MPRAKVFVRTLNYFSPFSSPSNSLFNFSTFPLGAPIKPGWRGSVNWAARLLPFSSDRFLGLSRQRRMGSLPGLFQKSTFETNIAALK